MITKEHYKQAVNVQDACNLSGIVFAFSEVMEAICEEAHERGEGTEWKNHHSICVLFAAKIASLTKCNNAFKDAYLDALRKSE